jgi:AcrR family transcriptional regulator
MSRHPYTRDHIVERAGELASQVGLTGLTIGALALHLHRPKSTVSWYFHAKTQLQLEVLKNAVREFSRDVLRPACAAPPGLTRLRRLFEEWLIWDRRGVYPGGCLFVATASEFDDRPGPVRDRLVRYHRAWLHLLRVQVNAAIAGRGLPGATDPEQFLQDLHGIMLAFHHAARLLRDPAAERRAVRAFEGLVGRGE